MANETNIITADQLTLYQLVRRASDGHYYNGSGFEAFNVSHWSTYVTPLTRVTLVANISAMYSGSFPVVAAGLYYVDVYVQAGESPVASDSPPRWEGQMPWGGTSEVSVTSLLGTVIVQPISGFVTQTVFAATNGGVVEALSVFQNSDNVFSWQISDAQSNQVNLSGHTIVFTVHKNDSDVVVDNTSEVTLSASDPDGHPDILDTVMVSTSALSVAEAGVFSYKLKDLVSGFTLGSGTFSVQWAP